MSKATTNALLKELKENNQDFEWYPTSKEMLEPLFKYFEKEDRERRIKSILDIGAGDGRTLLALSSELGANRIYAIEKATSLIQAMSREILNVGVDFWQTSLIEKEQDFIFCNPPYSEFEAWIERIIKEGNFGYFAFIVPHRWRKSLAIKRALRQRVDLKSLKILASFDFLAADRMARAKVDLVLLQTTKYERKQEKDIFSDFLEKQFGFNFEHIKEEKNAYAKERERIEELEDQTREIAKADLIDFLVSKYEKELREFQQAVASLKNIHPQILNSLNIDKEKLINSIKEQLIQLKAVYWNALFNELESIKRRMIKKYRNVLSSRVASGANIDFTKENIHSVVIWVIKNADKYIEQSYLDFFDRMAREDNAKHYKSNERFETDKWRYNREDYKHIPHKLDYRIVLQDEVQIDTLYRLHQTNKSDFLDDMCVIAHNLGFTPHSTWEKVVFLAGTQGEFERFVNENGTICKKVFAEYKAYKNHNLHIKFDKDFMAALNLAVGRLRGWLRNEAQAREEFKEASNLAFDSGFKKSLTLCKKDMPLMLANTQDYIQTEQNKEPSLFDNLDEVS
ncbi:DUF4942 domain-containing protein [Campylobacter sp. MIT 97-5078]|uniref:DUF4942 domain-containing protein n=1 Tax=Campylobacter sp. MIT 97-5078 TaxID=1548153 RepID=UPI00068A5BD8|nr:DUF4942 domain-containing protein [Campylobacter sp. MIT 97-5078]TQR23051.1 DUF4942 domain-containing protein [Campylobacter sp. MIT 97-5078]